MKQKRKIADVVYTPVIEPLVENNSVIIKNLVLEDRNVNITSLFVPNYDEPCRTIFRIFEDFNYLNQLMKEMTGCKLSINSKDNINVLSKLSK